MLRTFRTKIKFWSNVALWPVIIAFIAFYGWSFSGNQQKKGNSAAVVDDVSIGLDSVYHMRERYHQYYRQIYKDNYDRMTKGLDFQKLALDKLISDVILNKYAEQLGVVISTDEIRDSIKKTPYFQKNGQFSPGLYQLALRNLGMTAAQYEATVRQDLLLEKVRALIGSNAVVTDDELREIYKQRFVKINCDYFTFLPGKFMDKVTVTDADLKEYYDKNPEDFRVGDQIKVDYVHFNPEDYMDSIDVTDDDVFDYYDANVDRYKQGEQFRASHILFKVAKDAPKEKWDEALKKAQDIKKEIDAGEDFAELAKQYSEDSSASKGGDLGYFGKGRMVKPFQDAVESLEIGQVSDPVKSRFGYHIIKKTDYKKAGYKKIEDVKASIIMAIKQEQAKKQAMDKAQALFDSIQEGQSLKDAVKDPKIEIKQSDFFEVKSPPKEFGRSRRLDTILSNLEKGTVSIPVETFKGVFLFELIDTKPSYIPPFEEVIEKVRTKVKDVKASELARAEAEKVLADIKSGKTWDEVATEYDIKSQTTGDFTNSGYLPRLGSDKAIAEELFAMNVGQVSDIKLIRKNYVIFKIKSKNEFKEDEFKAKLNELRNQELSRRTDQAVSSFVDQMRKQLKEAGKLTIYLQDEENES